MTLLKVAGGNANIAAIGRKYLWTVGAVTLLAVTIGLLEGMGVTLLVPLLALSSDQTGSLNSHGVLGFIEHVAQGYSRNERLLIVSFAILGFVVLKSIVQAVANNFVSWIDGRIGHNIRAELSRRLQSVGYSFFLAEQSARLVNILTTESWRASDAVRVLLQRIAASAAVVVFGVLLSFVSWRLFLVVLIGGLLARAVQRRFERTLQAYSEGTTAVNEALADRMLFAVFGARLIRLFHDQVGEQARFESISDAVRRAILRRERASGMQTPVLEALHGTLFLIVVGVAVISGISMPVLIAFLVLMNRMQPHLRLLEQSAATFASASAHLGEVDWLLEEKGKPAAPQGELPFAGLRTAIQFDDVTLDYGHRNEPALSRATFTLRRGRATALIGSSGAGKSTVINLLCRLVEPTSGSIRVDGQPLSQTSVFDWLDTIAIAGQDIDLIDGTISENVSYGRERLDPEEIAIALRCARAEFVFNLPLGLNTRVGHHGISLSGGQRQRIGIARALARKPEILILDEATNALDHETESALIDTFRGLSRNLTLLVISHRIATLAFCDDAIVLDRGRVVESGPLSSTLAFQTLQTSMPPSPVGESGPVQLAGAGL